MKKTYFLLLLAFSCLSFGQTNNTCSTATQVLQLPYTFDQTDGVTSPNDGFVTACTGGMNDGLWYSFTGDGGYVSIKATTISDWNHQIGIYTGSCTDLVCSGTANREVKGVGKVETLTISTVPKTIYYVNVGQYDGYYDHAEGNFTIEITREASLATSETSGSKANNSVKLYPNPFKDVLHISDITNIKSVLIYDMSGKLIKTIDKPDSVLYLGELKQGTYLITLHKKDGSKQTLKAIKII
ncbi:T9SS type A sorting domain-containing protein [Chryseobacterium sp. KLBC 52]|uniref:T9SS type A sorting domain-containing protein n=1 Tax=Chryseobacterium sp. KLBC 52 TaxID=1862702 RepID=UPI000E0AF0DD|nr:T9SS type A sorting domain-containing protein [Chryseobacterium sp. KLBC 52]